MPTACAGRDVRGLPIGGIVPAGAVPDTVINRKRGLAGGVDGRGGTVELKWLEDFLSLARTGSFSRSAEERSVTQPALSRRIKSLEIWVGVPLVDRSSYPTRLTTAGETFLETARDMVRTLRDQRNSLRDRERAAQATVSFAALHTLAQCFLPGWLRQFEDGMDPFRTRLVADNLLDCVQALTDGDCDFLLCYAHPEIALELDPQLFPSIRLGKDRLLPLSIAAEDGGPRFALPGTREAPLPYLAYTAQSFYGRLVSILLERADQPSFLVPRIENSIALVLKALALKSHGLVWLPGIAVGEGDGGDRLVPAGSARWEVEMDIRIYRSIEKSRPIVDRFWALVIANSPAE